MELQTQGSQTEKGTWLDHYGFEGPFQPGVGPRRDPLGEFPTGPAIRDRLPDVVAPDANGQMVDVHAARNGGPLVLVFYRSAVW